MATRYFFGALFVAVAIMLIASWDGRVVASAQNEHEHGAAVAAATPPQGMHDMAKMHEAMMAEMKASEAKLDALVADMNKATGEARVAAMTAVVNELVRQHKAMGAHMGEMQQMMGGRATERH